MQIGKLYEYKKKIDSEPILVIITSGTYMGEGGVSNYWNFKGVDEEGKISSEVYGDYDNAEFKFSEIDANEYEIEVKLSEKLTDKYFPDNELGAYI